MKNSFTFIIRIWREGREDPGKAPVFRGVIEPVEGGEKFYFRDVSQIASYFAEFLGKFEATAKPRPGFWRRLGKK